MMVVTPSSPLVELPIPSGFPIRCTSRPRQRVPELHTGCDEGWLPLVLVIAGSPLSLGKGFTTRPSTHVCSWNTFLTEQGSNLTEDVQERHQPFGVSYHVSIFIRSREEGTFVSTFIH